MECAKRQTKVIDRIKIDQLAEGVRRVEIRDDGTKKISRVVGSSILRAVDS